MFTRWRAARRPARFHPDAPWPPADPWSANKARELTHDDRTGTTVWTDETCDEMCVIEHNMGGELRRHRHPACEHHMVPVDATAQTDAR